MKRRERDWQLGSWEWLEFASGLPANPEPLPVPGPNGLVMGGRAILRGYNFSNTSTTAGALVIYDGFDASGLGVIRVGYGATGTVAPAYFYPGILLNLGCFATGGLGALTGVLYLVPLWHYPDTAPGA